MPELPLNIHSKCRKVISRNLVGAVSPQISPTQWPAAASWRSKRNSGTKWISGQELSTEMKGPS